MDFEALQSRILDELPEMSAELRKAARHLVDHPDEVALSSMRDLAARSDVTPTTFVRLARRLGFQKWASLRQPFADRLRAETAPFAAKADALVRRRDSDSVFSDSITSVATNLAVARARNTDDDVVAACVLLERARGVRVAGFRSCRAPAHALVYLCRMFRSDVTLLGGDGGAHGAELAALAPGEAVVAIGFTPYSRELGPVIQAVRRSGAPLLAITDSIAAPIAQDASVTLRFSVDSPSFFPSIAAAMAIVEGLAATMLARSGTEAAARVRAIEAELFALGAYLSE